MRSVRSLVVVALVSLSSAGMATAGGAIVLGNGGDLSRRIYIESIYAVPRSALGEAVPNLPAIRAEDARPHQFS